MSPRYLTGLCLLLAAVADKASAEPLLIISIDGLHPKHVIDAQRHGVAVPHLREFVTEGTFATGVIGVLPTVTFPSNAPTTTLAARIRLGMITGAASLDLAPSRRFYAGGGSSVRGYGYQKIGPRDAFNDPTGGRSLTEFALETRVRIGEFSVVPFFDGGNIYDSALPSVSAFRYGAGIGVRYHSSFGPIRIDVGTPLNRQAGDSRIGVYVSLGQAF